MQAERAKTLSLTALGFILGEDSLRDRFLALSGMTADDMRSRIEDNDFLASILDFLMSHDPDLIACAEALNETPEELVSAWRALGGGIGQEW